MLFPVPYCSHLYKPIPFLLCTSSSFPLVRNGPSAAAAPYWTATPCAQGERCWMSPMTTEGLQEVRAALARNATRQTSVACYQNDGRRRMKLLWIVGARGRFGPEGHFPAGYRRITTPVRVSEWVRHAGLAARLAGLLHDLGKYSLKFQESCEGKRSWPMPCGMNGFRSSYGRRCDPAWTGRRHGRTCIQNASKCS